MLNLTQTFQVAEEEVAAIQADPDLADLSRGLAALFASPQAQEMLAQLLRLWGLNDPLPLEEDRRAAYISEGRRRAARELFTLTLFGQNQGAAAPLPEASAEPLAL